MPRRSRDCRSDRPVRAVGQDVPEFTGHSVAATDDLIMDQEGAADAEPDGDQRHRRLAGADAVPPLAGEQRADIVLHHGRHPVSAATSDPSSTSCQSRNGDSRRGRWSPRPRRTARSRSGAPPGGLTAAPRRCRRAGRQVGGAGADQLGVVFGQHWECRSVTTAIRPLSVILIRPASPGRPRRRGRWPAALTLAAAGRRPRGAGRSRVAAEPRGSPRRGSARSRAPGRSARRRRRSPAGGGSGRRPG